MDILMNNLDFVPFDVGSDVTFDKAKLFFIKSKDSVPCILDFNLVTGIEIGNSYCFLVCGNARVGYDIDRYDFYVVDVSDPNDYHYGLNLIRMSDKYLINNVDKGYDKYDNCLNFIEYVKTD